MTLAREKWLAVTIVALCALSDPAAAELRYTTTYKNHLVQGNTPQEVWQYMTQHPILDPDDGPALANITHDHSLAFATRSVGGKCEVTDLVFSWNFVITLAKAVDEKSMSPATESMWREFLAKTAWHEAHRRAIFLECGKTFTRAAEAMTGPADCAGLESRVRRYLDQQYDLCMKRQRDFGRQDAPLISDLRLIKAAKGSR